MHKQIRGDLLMTDFKYAMKLDINPTVGKAGDRVSITARFENVVGEIKNVSLSVPQYGVWEMFSRSGNNTFTLNYYIPYQAPSGTIRANINVTSMEGQRGPVETFSYTLQ